MSEPTAFPLDESKLPFKIPKDTKPREKIMKLGQIRLVIFDVCVEAFYIFSRR